VIITMIMVTLTANTILPLRLQSGQKNTAVITESPHRLPKKKKTPTKGVEPTRFL
jgi:hypothetical protein